MSDALKDVSRRTLTAGDRERADIILALGQLLKAWMTSRSESNGTGARFASSFAIELPPFSNGLPGVDIKMPEYAPSAADEFLQLDLRPHDCKAAVKGVSEVCHLAADMGGIGYISGSHATITLNNTLTNAHMIAAVSQSSVERFMPHQITAVYEAMLPRQPLRFLLADDPGDGKRTWPAC